MKVTEMVIHKRDFGDWHLRTFLSQKPKPLLLVTSDINISWKADICASQQLCFWEMANLFMITRKDVEFNVATSEKAVKPFENLTFSLPFSLLWIPTELVSLQLKP